MSDYDDLPALIPIPNPLETYVSTMFNIRDIRGGYGQRQLFRDMFGMLYESHPTLAANLLEIIPHYGYWKDFFYAALNHRSLMQPALAIAKKQLLQDEAALAEGRQISLFARWIPKEGKKDGRFAKEFANYLYKDKPMSFSQSMRSLRQRISLLNAATSTVETLQCANRWDEIQPAMVPKMARTKMRAAFLNEEKPINGRAACIRNPDDRKRMACREKFQAAAYSSANFEPRPINGEASPRYDAVHERVRNYLNRGDTV